MHKINVLAIGSENFNTSLEELKEYLNFKLTTINNNLKKQALSNQDVLFIHENYLENNYDKKILENTDKIKILVFNSKISSSIVFSDKLSLPTTIEDINQVIANSIVKKSFNKNSSIKIKNYILDKNEKKLIKEDNFILLTEKEIQLLDLFLINSDAISKNKILKEVWKYSSDADTHTVETHIYRLRKKIKSKFLDEDFIINNTNGYLL
jgi:hypothetical protein